MRRILVAVAVIVVGAATAVAVLRNEQAFTLAEVEAVFDGVGLDVESIEPYHIVFLEPKNGEDFVIAVFDDRDEAWWSYKELERVRRSIRAELDSIEVPLGFGLRRANVLVDIDSGVSRTTIEKIESALARLD